MSLLHKQTLNYIKRDPRADYVNVLRYILLNETGQTRIPDDIEYEKAIRTYPFYEQHGGNIRSYVLSALDSSSKEAKSTLRLIAEDNLDLTVEHVMPQTLSREEWKKMLGSDYERIHSEYLHTLANLTLTGYNSDYSNRPYQEKMVLEIKSKKTGEVKQVGFKFSPLPMNKWIAAHDTWNEGVLVERREMWVSKLQEVWSLPTTSFQPVTGASIDILGSISLRGESIRSITVLGDKTTISTWVEALDVIADSLYAQYPNMIELMIEDKWLTNYLKQDSSAFRSNIEIGSSGYYIATSNNTDTKLQIIRRTAALLGLFSGDIEAEIGTKEDEKDP